MPADDTPENAKDKHFANSAALPAAPSRVRLKSNVWHLGMHNGTACKSPAEHGMSINVSCTAGSMSCLCCLWHQHWKKSYAVDSPYLACILRRQKAVETIRSGHIMLQLPLLQLICATAAG